MRRAEPAVPARILALLVPVLPLAACARAPVPDVHARAANAMGTVVEMKVVVAGEAAGERVLDAGYAELRRVELLATPHDPGSELSRVNARPDAAFSVTAELDSMLSLALDVAARSGGAFDPTIGALVRAWGFPEHPALPDSAAVDAARRTVDWRSLRRADSPRTWIDGGPRSVLDLGGIAKGWAVDRAADVLSRSGRPCLVNAGGDLACRGAKPGGQPWIVGVQHPRDPSALYCRLRVPDGAAVATSGDYERFFEADGVRYHHLLDPSTGRPARGAVSATVVAPTCAAADAWATAVFVLGPAEGIAALEREADLEGLILTLGPDGAPVPHETAGFAALRLP